jgi:hypothetical protein
MSGAPDEEANILLASLDEVRVGNFLTDNFDKVYYGLYCWSTIQDDVLNAYWLEPYRFSLSEENDVVLTFADAFDERAIADIPGITGLSLIMRYCEGIGWTIV